MKLIDDLKSIISNLGFKDVVLVIMLSFNRSIKRVFQVFR